MERCGFFDAELVGEEYDRSYLAEQFAAYFASFIGNGVYGGKSDELQIVAMENPSMQVVGLSGQGWINGYWYENTDELYLPIDVADGVLDRIDSVVLRLGFAERDMWITVKRGTPSNNPLAPELVRNADYYELQLATIYIKAGALNIKQADITDTRLDSNVCGFVVAVVNEFDTSAFYAQLDSWIELFKAESVEEVNALTKQLEAIINAGDVGPLVTEIENIKSLGFGANPSREVSLLELDSIFDTGWYILSEYGTNLGGVGFNYANVLVHYTALNSCMQELRILGSNIMLRRCSHLGVWEEWEVVNPPYDVDVEYRTIKRRNSKVVYEKLGADGVLRYRLEGSSTWNTYATENGAVKKTGDTMSNDLTIEKAAAPSLRLNATGSGAGAIVQMWGNQLIVANRIAANVEDNYRYFSVNNLNMQDDVAYAIGLADIRNGVTNYYTVLHSGNLHLYGIGVVPASVE